MDATLNVTDYADKQIRQDNAEPLIPNKSAEMIRFEVPSLPTFSVFPSILSILSLILMSGLSVYILLQLKDQATWVKLPFIFTIIGGTIGWIFESALLIGGTPFQPFYKRFNTFIQRLRYLNIAPVVTTLFFFVCSMVIQEPNLRMALLFLAVATCFALGVASFYGLNGGNGWVPLIILGAQIAQFLIVLAADTPVGGNIVKYLLLGQAVCQATAFLIGTKTPMKSTAFHILSTFSGLAAFGAISKAIEAQPDFSHQIAALIPSSSFLTLGLILTAIAGVVMAMKASPMVYNTWRASASNVIWSFINFMLISGKRFPKPFNLSEIYDKEGTPEPSTLKPYYQQHPEFLPKVLNIPAVEKIEGTVTAFGDAVKGAESFFKTIALIENYFPQANIDIPLKDKPRMKPWSNGADIYPNMFLRTFKGDSLPNPELKPTPEPAIATFKEGQLLAYLAEYGIASPLLRDAGRGDGTLVIDFQFLEKYDTKADYESYGGRAFFKVNSQKKKLELISVIAPHSDKELSVNPMDSTFRHAESMILASLYYQVIAGKHLGEIHMTYNLLEVVLHNAFEAQGQWKHPVRTFMYLHLFSHELAEELTTEHLVQERAVFSQIFATTHSSMINYLNDTYHRFNYGDDENFELRAKLLTMDNGEVLPGACVNWELEYAEIFQRYTGDIIDIVYKDDAAIQKDKYVQDVYRGLNEVMLNGLPERYDAFQTKAGVARWAADTIYHLVVRHQVYGTTGINAAMDPRISSTQVPKDRGTQGVDEWRSLIGIGLATACSRFTLLLDEERNHSNAFVYLLEGVDEAYKDKMAKVFIRLQEDLWALDDKWTANDKEKQYNYDFFRATPSDLRTGPGY